jgi:hypothetical protein
MCIHGPHSIRGSRLAMMAGRILSDELIWIDDRMSGQ